MPSYQKMLLRQQRCQLHFPHTEKAEQDCNGLSSIRARRCARPTQGQALISVSHRVLSSKKKHTIITRLKPQADPFFASSWPVAKLASRRLPCEVPNLRDVNAPRNELSPSDVASSACTVSSRDVDIGVAREAFASPTLRGKWKKV